MAEKCQAKLSGRAEDRRYNRFYDLLEYEAEASAILFYCWAVKKDRKVFSMPPFGGVRTKGKKWQTAEEKGWRGAEEWGYKRHRFGKYRAPHKKRQSRKGSAFIGLREAFSAGQSIFSKYSFSAPHLGQTHSSGRSSKSVPGSIPFS
jgi:hypothetical protein